MLKWFRRIWYGISKDREFNYHKLGCYFRNRRFTVIRNGDSMKMCEGSIKYCPICGEKLRD